MEMRSISDQGQGPRKENRINDHVKMAATGERTIFHVIFKEGYCTIEPTIDMPWRNRGN